MNRRHSCLWALLLLGPAAGACNNSKGSSADAASSVPTNVLTLWEERPAPPSGTSIGVYVATTGAPAGTLVLESREARVCALAGQASIGAADTTGPADDAGPPACPFEQRFTVMAGDERFAVILAPLWASVPPLLAASLVDQTGDVVATVLRRFYPITAGTDAGAATDGSEAATDGGADGAPTGSADAAVTDGGGGQ